MMIILKEIKKKLDQMLPNIMMQLQIKYFKNQILFVKKLLIELIKIINKKIKKQDLDNK